MQKSSRAIKPSRLRERRRKIRLIKMGLGLFCALLLIGGIIWISRMQALALSEINIVGNNVVSGEDLKAIVEQDLDGYYGYVFPKRNAFLYPKKKIQNDILAAYPRIKSATLALEGTQSLRVEVTERQPFALWCKDVEVGSDACYFIDDQGFIFSEAPDFQGDVFVKYYGLVTSEQSIGGHFLDASRLADLQTFVRAVNEQGLTSLALRASTAHDFELDIDGGGKILFSDNQPFPQILSNLSTVLGSLPMGSKSVKLLDYIDLRFSNKIFYKTSTSTESSSL